MLGYFVTAPIFGYLGDRFPRKYLMLAGVIVWSLATAATGLAHNLAELFAIRIFVGFGEAAFVTMGPSWLSDVFAATRRNSALTLFYVAIPVGSALGFGFGGQFAQAGAWREAFIWAGIPGALLALVLLALREPSRGEADGLPAGSLVPARLAEMAGLLREKRYVLLIGGYSAQTFAIGAFAFWGPTFLTRVHGFSLNAAGTIFGALLAGTGLLATLAGGFGANYLRRRRADGYVWLMAGSIVAAVPFCAAALLTANAPLCLVGLGASMFLLFLPTGPIASEMFSIVPIHLRATAMALCTFFIHLLGDFASPAIVGSIAKAAAQVGGAAPGPALRMGVLLLPGVLGLGALLWVWLLRVTPRVPELVA